MAPGTINRPDRLPAIELFNLPLGSWLLEPRGASDSVEQRTGRLISAIALLEVVLLLLAFVFSGAVALLVLALANAIAYGAARLGKARTAALIMSVSLAAWILPYMAFNPDVNTENLVSLSAWVVLSMLVASMVFRSLTTALIAVASLVMLAGSALFFPGMDFGTYGSMIALPFTTMLLLLVLMVHRDAVERDRQASLLASNRALRESEAEIRRALARAEEADQLKSQFLASMSHELRTPLNAILSFNKLLKMGTFGEVNDEQVEYLGKSIDSASHLLALINDVLDVTKIQSGMMKLFIEDDFDVSVEVQSVADTAEKLLTDKPVTLIRDIDADLPLLTCDKRRVRQILLNLMSNAVKFTEQGAITLSAKKRADHILISVADTGPGIPADQHEMIFDPFVQTETGIKHATGTGLGLPISLNIAEAHGGQLWLESTVGKGSTFYVGLPITPGLKLGELEM